MNRIFEFIKRIWYYIIIFISNIRIKFHSHKIHMMYIDSALTGNLDRDNYFKHYEIIYQIKSNISKIREKIKEGRLS